MPKGSVGLDTDKTLHLNPSYLNHLASNGHMYKTARSLSNNDTISENTEAASVYITECIYSQRGL